MKNVFHFQVILFLFIFNNVAYSRETNLKKIEIVGKDTSFCLRKFPSQYPSPAKRFQSKGYFSLSYKLDSFSITQYFNPDSQIVCQKCLINDRLLSVLAISRNGILIPEINFTCGNGKIRDYNKTFEQENWGGLFMYNALSVTDLYYNNGSLVTKVELGMSGNDSIKLERYQNDTLNGWSNYYNQNKVSYRRLYKNGFEENLSFAENGFCKKENLVYDSVKDNYSLNEKICEGKISVFITEGFFNGMLDREIFFTKGKADSVIVYHSNMKVVINYNNKNWDVFQYFPNGKLNWTNHFIFEKIPTEQNKIFEFPDHGTGTKLDGVSITYYPNGQASIISTFKNGIKDGKWIYYDEQGNITRTITYKGDVIISDN